WSRNDPIPRCYQEQQGKIEPGISWQSRSASLKASPPVLLSSIRPGFPWKHREKEDASSRTNADIDCFSSFAYFEPPFSCLIKAQSASTHWNSGGIYAFLYGFRHLSPYNPVPALPNKAKCVNQH
ncbi:MAG: hypothetical protein SPJ34_01210, partial [Candidatus Ornithospirochaeta sp.]|nr:hypothetical protein [Candidatus Ornithospirochaeta sp.]